MIDIDLSCDPDETVELKIEPLPDFNELPHVRNCNEALLILASAEMHDRLLRMKELRYAAIMPLDFYDDQRYAQARAMAKDIAKQRDEFIKDYVMLTPRNFIIRRTKKLEAEAGRTGL